MRSSTCWSSMELSLPALSHVKSDSRLLQPPAERIAHRGRRRQLTGALGQLVEGETEAGLGENLRALAVAGVAAADLGDDPLAASLADEDDLEPAALALGLAGALPRRFQLQQQLPGRRQLGQGAGRSDAGGDCANRSQVLGDHVVAVGEVVAVAVDGVGGAADE